MVCPKRDMITISEYATGSGTLTDNNQVSYMQVDVLRPPKTWNSSWGSQPINSCFPGQDLKTSVIRGFPNCLSGI